MWTLSRQRRGSQAHLIALHFSGERVRLGVFELEPARAAKPHLISDEELDALALADRLSELTHAYASMGVALRFVANLEGSEVHTMSLVVPDGAERASLERKIEATAARANWTPDVLRDSDLLLQGVLRDDRCLIAVARGDAFDRKLALVSATPLLVAPSALAFLSLVEQAHPEAIASDASLCLTCTDSEIAVAVYEAGTPILVHQLDLAGVTEAGGRSGTFGGSRPTDVYLRVFDTAFSRIFKFIADAGVVPSAISHVYVSGSAVDDHNLVEHLSAFYRPDHRIRVRPIEATRIAQFTPATDTERERARDILYRESTYSGMFALVAHARAKNPLWFSATPEAEAPTPSPVAAKLRAVSSPERLMVLIVATLIFFGFAAYQGLVSWETDRTQKALEHARAEAAVYAGYRRESDLEDAKLRHKELVTTTAAHVRAIQDVPLAIVEDITRAYQQMPPPDPTLVAEGRLEMETVTRAGTKITITGRTPFEADALSFARLLGDLDERERFLDVKPETGTKILSGTPDHPEPVVRYTFSVTASYQPGERSHVSE